MKNWMNEKSAGIPTVKPGIQQISIAKIEDQSDEKGNRVLVTFTTVDGAAFTKMFFAKSMAKDAETPDWNYQHMRTQLGYKANEDVAPSEVFKVGNTFYANVKYGVDAQGFNKVYPNILSSDPTEAVPSESPIE